MGIDANTADGLNSEDRSRLVGPDVNSGKHNASYASTHATAGKLRSVVSWAASIDKSGSGHAHELMVDDVRRAYFDAD